MGIDRGNTRIWIPAWLIIRKDWGMVADPGGVDPDPTFKKKQDPDPTVKNKTRKQIR